MATDRSVALAAVLADAHRLGILGEEPTAAIERSRRFVDALEGCTGRLIDLGSGAGIPGLVIAVDRPDLEIVLVDRRQRRTDTLRRAVARLGLGDRVRVLEADIDHLLDPAPSGGPLLDPASFDIVTARGAGPPAITLERAAALLCPTGRIVISDPPPPADLAARWPAADLERLGLVRRSRPGVSVFESIATGERPGVDDDPDVSRETEPSPDPTVSEIEIGAEARQAGDSMSSLPAPHPEQVATERRTTRVIAIANQKGGVGKTTTAVNLGSALAELGQRVLLVDLDPQGNASTGLGVDSRRQAVSVYQVLLQGIPLAQCIQPTTVAGLDLAPSNLELAGAEIELVSVMSRESRLRQALSPVLGRYDYVLIDCPPALGLLTVNAMTAASEVLVPVQCEYYALEGLSQLWRNVELVKQHLNPSLEISAIVCVMYDGRTNLSQEVVNEVRHNFGDRVLATVVPRTVRISEAQSFGQSILAFDPRSRGAEAYRDIAREVHHGSS